MKVCLWVLNWQADVRIYMHGLWYQGSKIGKKIFLSESIGTLCLSVLLMKLCKTAKFGILCTNLNTFFVNF
jgi:hypothetical protein